MSKYPVWWDTTITIFNRYEDVQTHLVRWYKTIVTGAFWKYVRDKMYVGEETLEVEKILCRIRQNAAFLEKQAWIEKANDEKEQFFTLSRGDILIRGEVTDDIDEYTAGNRSTDLIDKYKETSDCMEVETISINVGRGRVNPHYLVEGL